MVILLESRNCSLDPGKSPPSGSGRETTHHPGVLHHLLFPPLLGHLVVVRRLSNLSVYLLEVLKGEAKSGNKLL